MWRLAGGMGEGGGVAWDGRSTEEGIEEDPATSNDGNVRSAPHGRVRDSMRHSSPTLFLAQNCLLLVLLRAVVFILRKKVFPTRPSALRPASTAADRNVDSIKYLRVGHRLLVD